MVMSLQYDRVGVRIAKKDNPEREREAHRSGQNVYPRSAPNSYPRMKAVAQRRALDSLRRTLVYNDEVSTRGL